MHVDKDMPDTIELVQANSWKTSEELTSASLPLQSICKQEAANRPCPRIMLVCCTSLVTGGLSAEGLFQKEAPDDLVHFLLGAFEEGVCLSMQG